MLPVLSPPGVYHQRADAGPDPVAPMRTDVAGFVGVAERGPVDVPVQVQSWRQFASWFGQGAGPGLLPLAVRAFFENGGRQCWVVRVAALDDAAGARAAAAVVTAGGVPTWRVRASSPGTWGNRLTVTVRERHRAHCVVAATAPDGFCSEVSDVAGLGRGTLARLSQDGLGAPVWRVISHVDPHRRLVHWVHPDPAARLPSDTPLRGLDGGAPAVMRSVDYTVTVEDGGRLVRQYPALTLVPQHPDHGPRRLPALDPAGGGATAPPEPVVIEELRPDPRDVRGLDTDPAAVLPLVGGRDGLAPLSVADFVGQPAAPDDGPAAVARKRRGLRALEEVAQVRLLAVPDAHLAPTARHRLLPPTPPPRDLCVPCTEQQPPPPSPPASAPEEPPAFGPQELFLIQAEMVAQCERTRDRFALLDVPRGAALERWPGTRGALEWRALFDSPYAALYHPWVRVPDPSGAGGPTLVVPPSGHVAGLVAATDLAVGVHRAPANIRLAWAVDATADVGEDAHAALNAAGVNVLRTIPGRGLRVLGARTTSADPRWRYVNVRRLVTMIATTVETALQWVVFEPNGPLTRARATMSLTFFLLGLHEAGMLAGATPEESFVVVCDVDNNPPSERDAGRLVADIAIAPSIPFEYVVLRVGKVRDALEVTETGAAGALGQGA